MARRERTGHTIEVQGNLVFGSVPARLRESERWFTRASGNVTVIDLGGVTMADSAGVALLLEWMRRARTAGVTLQFTNTPAQMQSIIEFCSLDDVIPIGRDAETKQS